MTVPNFHCIPQTCCVHPQQMRIPLSSPTTEYPGHAWVLSRFICVWLFVTPRTAARQALLSFTISRSLLKLMSIESVMSSNHLILCHPLLLLPSISQHQGLFHWISSSHQVAKVLEVSFSISPSDEYSGLISFRIDWLIHLLAAQGNFKNLL